VVTTGTAFFSVSEALDCASELGCSANAGPNHAALRTAENSSAIMALLAVSYGANSSAHTPCPS
jgi:hypothetical protein